MLGSRSRRRHQCLSFLKESSALAAVQVCFISSASRPLRKCASARSRYVSKSLLQPADASLASHLASNANPAFSVFCIQGASGLILSFLTYSFTLSTASLFDFDRNCTRSNIGIQLDRRTPLWVKARSHRWNKSPRSWYSHQSQRRRSIL